MRLFLREPFISHNHPEFLLIHIPAQTTSLLCKQQEEWEEEEYSPLSALGFWRLQLLQNFCMDVKHSHYKENSQIKKYFLEQSEESQRRQEQSNIHNLVKFGNSHVHLSASF